MADHEEFTEIAPPTLETRGGRVLVALSGGVDSSVALWLLREAGVPVEAAYMKNWINEDNILGDCPWEEDIRDARRVADQLGVPFRVVNLMDEYREKVVSYLLDGYMRGFTPNPDVMCNREVKFGVLRAWAAEHGFAAVATGHYARRTEVEGGEIALLEGADPDKDQSYFLAMLDQAQLRDARFPVGHLRKPELRALAKRVGLATAAKKDSQGICFIGKVKMADFLRAYVSDAPGPIVRAEDRRVVGEHRGLHFFTLGQRKGIGVPSNTDGKAYVVVGKRSEDRALLVAFDGADAPGLHGSSAWIGGIRWNTLRPPLEQLGSVRLEGRVRYRDQRVGMVLEAHEGDRVRAVFDEPQRGLASGQILAIHDGPRLLGGGVFL